MKENSIGTWQALPSGFMLGIVTYIRSVYSSDLHEGSFSRTPPSMDG